MEKIGLESTEGKALVLHCMDGNMFHVLNEETGGLVPPVKGEVVIAKDVQLENILGKLKPVMKCRGHARS